MADRPIIFSAPMVRALLEGRKTQTRRLAWVNRTRRAAATGLASTSTAVSAWQHVQPGDRLWVRENLRLGATSTAWCYVADARLISLDYPDHRMAQMVGWAHHQQRENVPSIHMPRWASRITLTVTDVRRQPLQEISAGDAIAEGMPTNGMHRDGRSATAIEAFASVWSELHGSDSWDANPEIVAIAFTAVCLNVDAKAAA